MRDSTSSWACPVPEHAERVPSMLDLEGRDPLTTLAGGTPACAHPQCVHTAAGRRALNTSHILTYPWPEDCFVQGGGDGVVFTRSEQPDGTFGYRTAFVEAMPRDPQTFLRGEGATIVEAEHNAWQKWQRYLTCPTGGAHTYEPRNYTNGAGICSACGLFSSKVFTGSELGQFCVICSVGTTYSQEKLPGGQMAWLCESHYNELPKFPAFGLFFEGYDDASSLPLVAAHVPSGTPASIEDFNSLPTDIRSQAVTAAKAEAISALLTAHGRDKL
jgi:hypothetical protein